MYLVSLYLVYLLKYMATLYRKYRPQGFSDLVGQNHIKTTLEYEIASGNIAHAYLFCGPRGTGKTTIARILAKAINCKNRKNGEHEPCNQCIPCEDLKNDRSLDIIEIDAASHTGVDNVRENIISASRIAPTSLNYKVFIIDEVHMLSNQAFNALLKILEEPPKNVVFVLCTTEIHKIPTTIISRCQRFDFKKISIGDMVKKLQYIVNSEKIKVSKEILENIARHADGHMRDAESLLGQVIVVGGTEITKEEAELVIPRSDLSEIIKLIDFLIKKDAGSGINLVNNLIFDGVDIKKFLSDTVDILRKIMLIKTSSLLAEKLANEFGENLEKEINRIAQNLDIARTISFLEKFLKVRALIDNTFIVQLPIEIAIVELCMETGVINNNPSKFNAAAFNTNKTVDPGRPVNYTDPIKKDIVPEIVELKTKTNSRLIDKTEIYSKWNEVLARVKQQNHSLSFILRICQPKDIQGNQLCLAFKYKFHKDRVGDANIKRLIENILKDVYKENITIEAVIDEKLNVSDGGDSVVPPDSVAIENKNEISVSREQDNSGHSVVNDESNEQQKQNTENKGAMIENLLKTFGGEVVS